MAMTRAETNVTWSSAASITVSSNTQADSDTITVDATTTAIGMVIHADNQGTPATGDYIDIYLKPSVGDVDGSAGDDFATDEHATFLCRLNTFSTDTPGEDPARIYVELPIAMKSFKLSHKGNQTATRNIVLRARMHEVRVA